VTGPISIRPTGPADGPRVATLLRRSLPSLRTLLGELPARPPDDPGGGTVLAAHLSGSVGGDVGVQLIGAAWLRNRLHDRIPGWPVWTLEALAVRDRHRHAGLGRKLLDAARAAAAAGRTVLYASCPPEVAGFYAKAGFALLPCGASLVFAAHGQPAAMTCEQDQNFVVTALDGTTLAPHLQFGDTVTLGDGTDMIVAPPGPLLEQYLRTR
jgi:GNAT superfamily N-acetyltransferase